MKRKSVWVALILSFLTYFLWVGEIVAFYGWMGNSEAGLIWFLQLLIFICSITLYIVWIVSFYLLKKLSIIKKNKENKVSSFILLIIIYSGFFLLLQQVFGQNFELHFLYQQLKNFII